MDFYFSLKGLEYRRKNIGQNLQKITSLMLDMEHEELVLNAVS